MVKNMFFVIPRPKFSQNGLKIEKWNFDPFHYTRRKVKMDILISRDIWVSIIKMRLWSHRIVNMISIHWMQFICCSTIFRKNTSYRRLTKFHFADFYECFIQFGKHLKSIKQSFDPFLELIGESSRLEKMLNYWKMSGLEKSGYEDLTRQMRNSLIT